MRKNAKKTVIRIEKNKRSLIERLISKGIIKSRIDNNLDSIIQAIDKQHELKDLQDKIDSNKKKLAMGNRNKKADFYFGTKANTHAGNVCRLIALKQVKSIADIRNKYTKKYTFNETLNRLQIEGIIKFNDNTFKTFELTSKGNELANMYKSIFND